MQRIDALQHARADWLPRAVVAGFSGAVTMLLAFLIAYGLSVGAARAALPEPLRGWFYGLSHNALTDLAGGNIYIAAGVHFAVAIGLALLYGRFVEGQLGGPGWVRGGLFALVPWLLSILVVLPLQGGGLLGAALGAGPLPVLGNFVLHLLYGATLGTVYGPLGDLPADSWLASGPVDAPEATRAREVLLGKGLAVGLASGLAAALVAVNLLPASGTPSGATILGWALLGAVFGALCASLVGFGQPEPRPVAPTVAPARLATAAAAEPSTTAPSPTRWPKTTGYRPPARPRPDNAHAGAMAGALLGTVAVGPLGMPIGAAAGAVVDAIRAHPPAFPSHTHNTDLSPCYDGCPAWHPSQG